MAVDDARISVLERVTLQHSEWFDDMQVGVASKREREAYIHLARWWVRGIDNRAERRKMLVTLSLICGVVSALGAFIGNYFHHA